MYVCIIIIIIIIIGVNNSREERVAEQQLRQLYNSPCSNVVTARVGLAES